VRAVSLGVVRALISASGWPDLVDDTVAAVRAQPEPPASIAVHPSMNAGAAMVRALERGADWLWLLDGLTVPEPGALRGFAGALEALSGYPEPFVLQSKVLDGAVALHPDALPRHQIFERRCTVAAVERGLVQIRAAPSGSLLARRHRGAGRSSSTLPVGATCVLPVGDGCGSSGSRPAGGRRAPRSNCHHRPRWLTVNHLHDGHRRRCPAPGRPVGALHRPSRR